VGQVIGLVRTLVTGNIVDSVSIYAQEYLNAKTNLKFVTSSIYIEAELQNLGAHKRKNSFSSNKAQMQTYIF